MNNVILFISFLFIGLGLSAQNQATPITTTRSDDPINVSVVQVVSTSIPIVISNEVNMNATPKVSGISNVLVNAIPVATTSTNSSNKISANQSIQQSTAVANPVVLKLVPQTSTAKMVKEENKNNK